VERQALLKDKQRTVAQMKTDVAKANPKGIVKSDIAHINTGGLKNAHPLVDEKVTLNNKQVFCNKFGQIGCDVNPPNTQGRGEGRGVYDYIPNAPKNQRFVPAGYTSNHKYENTPNYGESPFFKNHEKYDGKLAMNKFSIGLATTNASVHSQSKKKKNEHDD